MQSVRGLQRTTKKKLIHAIVLLSLGVVLANGRAAATELPAAVKARLFERTRNISFSSSVARIAMRGTDHAGNRKCPYVQVYVNGKGPFTFLYDTGATYLIVSDKVAKAAAVSMVFDRGGARDAVHVDNLSIGGFHAHDLVAIVDDSFGVDGVIGFPTLGNAIVVLDFARRQMLLSRKPIALQRAFTLPYTAPDGIDVPAIPVGLGGRTVPVLIDTGDDAYGLELRSSELRQAAIEHAPVAAVTVMNGSKSQKTSTTTLVDPITLGPTEAKSAGVALNDDLPIGDLGYDVLRQFRFEIDPVRHTVTLQPQFRGKRFSVPLPHN